MPTLRPAVLRRSLPALLCGLAASGCTVVESHFSEQLPAQGVRRITATVDKGDLHLVGSAAPAIQVDGRAWGRASDEERAAARHDANHWALESTGSTVALVAANDLGGGIDFTVAVPPATDSALSLAGGTATLDHLRGVHSVHADRVRLVEVGGQLVLHSGGDVDGSLALAPGDTVEIVADWGDVSLELPWGLAYDLQIWADPDAGVVVEDLGFQAVVTEPGYLAARSGPGSVRIDIVAPEGRVEVVSW